MTMTELAIFEGIAIAIVVVWTMLYKYDQRHHQEEYGWSVMLGIPFFLVLVGIAGMVSWVFACGGWGEHLLGSQLKFTWTKLFYALWFFMGHKYLYKDVICNSLLMTK